MSALHIEILSVDNHSTKVLDNCTVITKKKSNTVIYSDLCGGESAQRSGGESTLSFFFRGTIQCIGALDCLDGSKKGLDCSD